MSQDFVKRLDTVFVAYRELRVAEIRHDNPELLKCLSRALADSCVLLQDILMSPDLLQLRVDPMAITNIRQQDLISRFVETERNLLGYTDLSPALITELIGLAENLMSSASLPPENWRSGLKSFSDEVCAQATEVARHLKQELLLRRAIAAAGGSVIAMINLSPPIVGLPGWAIAASCTVGGWLIAAAAKDQLADFLKKWS